MKQLIFLLIFLYVGQAKSACTLSGSISFGTYSPFLSTPNDSSGSINVSCGLNLLVTVNISAGQSGMFSNRYLSSGNNKLNYNLYTNAARTTIFGDGTNGTSNFGSLILLQASIPVYARLPAKQNAVPGFYTDNPTVTVIF